MDTAHPAIPEYSIAPFTKADSTQIKGTYYYRNTLQQLFSAHHGRDNQEFEVTVTLVPEPDNPHSPGTAISVRWNDRVIGHIAADEVDKYQQIRRIAASGYDASTTASVWTNTNHNNEREFWVRVALPAPELIAPLNDPPREGFAVLPPGSRAQVTKESEHLNVLTEFLPPSGYGQVLTSLHIIGVGTRTKREAIEVRLDGERIGELSKVTSEKFIPLVRHFEDGGLTTVARATIRGSSVAVEVDLFAARAHEVSEDALDLDNAQGLPRLVPFEPDARNYDAPNRWPGESRENTWIKQPTTTFTPNTTFAPRPWERDALADPFPDPLAPSGSSAALEAEMYSSALYALPPTINRPGMWAL